MFPQPRLPARQPGVHPPPLPPKQPFRLHPSCVLALLPQQDAVWWDYSGYGNHGVPHGPKPTAKGRYGFAWEFDGVDDYVVVRNDPSLNFGTGDFTLQARIYSRGFRWQGSAWNVILSKHTLALYPATFYGFYTTSDNRAYFVVNDHKWLAVSTTVIKDDWYHLVGTRRGDTLEIFVNGVLEDTGGTSASVDSPEPLRIPRDGTPGRFLNVIFSDVKIYNRGWSPNPADPNYLPEIDPGTPPYSW